MNMQVLQPKVGVPPEATVAVALGRSGHDAIPPREDESLGLGADFVRRDTAEVGFSEISNFPSIAAADFLGVGFAGYVKWFGRAVPFRTAGAKRIGFELFARQPSDDRLFRYRRV